MDLAVIDPDTVQNWVQAGGYLVIFGLLFACGLGLPLPEDIPLILGGFFVGKGDLHLGAVAIVAWLGIIGGDCVLYSLAKKYGLNITKVPFIGSHVTEERILRAEKLFEKYGVWIVAVGRLVAGIRGAMVIAAGAIRFNFIKFVIADGLAALISGGMFVAIGYWFGRKFGNKKLSEIRQDIKPYEHWILLGILLAVLLVILYILIRKRTHSSLTDVALSKAQHLTSTKPAPAGVGDSVIGMRRRPVTEEEVRLECKPARPDEHEDDDPRQSNASSEPPTQSPLP